MKTAGNALTPLAFTNFSETVTRVAGEIQMGAAFHEGEQPLAVVEHEVPDKGRGRDHFGALVVTDRRLYGRGNFSTKPDTSFELSLSQILSFTPGGLTSGPVCRLRAARSRRRFSAISSARAPSPAPSS